MAVTVVLDFVGFDPVTGLVQIPLPVIAAHAEDTALPAGYTHGFEARLNGTTILTSGPAQQEQLTISNTDLKEWQWFNWIWVWTSPGIDPNVLLNDMIEFRAFTNPHGTVVNSAWSSPVGFIGNPQPASGPPSASYSVGTPHAFLSGAGSFAVSNNVGVRVNVVTSPLGYGQTQDTPPREVPAFGQIAFEDANGIIEPHLLHYDRELIFSGLPTTVQIDYSFHPGWVVTLFELH